MIRITSKEQAQNLREHIPGIVLLRAQQFMGPGYETAQHGHLVVIEEGDNLTEVTEVSDAGLVLNDEDGCPCYEFIEGHKEKDMVIFEITFQVDDSRTIAVFLPDAPWLDPRTREMLIPYRHFS